jgi:hypothetical protein
MALKESGLGDSLEIEMTETGLTGTRVFFCDNGDQLTLPPRLGDQHPLDDRLFAVAVKIKGHGLPVQGDELYYEQYKVTVRYESRDLLRQVWSHDIRLREIGSMLGRLWDSTGYRAWDQEFTITIPQIESTCLVWHHSDPQEKMHQAAWHVNDDTFLSTAAEETLYLGARITTAWTNLDEMLWKAEHKFLWQPFSHNIVWRKGAQQRDAAGNLLWVAATGQPTMVAGAPGACGWDRLVPPLYESADFSRLLLTG